MRRHRILRPSISLRRRASIAGPLIALLTGGCHLPDAASPAPGGGARASIALNAQFVLLLADAINVRVTYSRTDGTATLIDSTVKISKTKTGEVKWEGNRGFPVEIDLSTCLLDPTHVVSGRGCLIGMTVRMLQNSVEIDRTIIAPFGVEPGKLTVVPQAIVLREIGIVDIDAPVQVLRVGEGALLGVRVTDVAGDPITGRTVSWRSTNEGVARVQADGNIVAVGPGQVAVTARVGTHEGSVALTVTPQ